MQTTSAWLRITVIAAVVAMALPVWAAPDANGDGSVDFCDGVIFSADFFSQNLRSDFNNDGFVNISDAAILSAVYCTGPAQSVVQGAATIGVYFDPAGTMTQLVNVPASTFVTFYVVAHGVTDPGGMGGYTFQVTDNSSAIITNDAPPAGFLANPGHVASPDGKCALGSDTTCLGPGGAIVLNTYTLLFNGIDTTLEVVGLNHCSAPSVSPSYVSCGVAGIPCDWTYFTYGASNGQAFITSQPVGVETESWSTVKAQYR